MSIENPSTDHPGWRIARLYWRWKETLALVSLDIAAPFIPPMGLRFQDSGSVRALARPIVVKTLTWNQHLPDQPQFLAEARQLLIELAHRQSTDAAYSLWCVALHGSPDDRISESLHAWNKAFSMASFFELLPSREANLVAGPIQRYLDDDATWTRQANEAVRTDLSEWDKALLAGGYYEDPAARFYPEALIDDVIRWRSVRRLWVIIAAIVGTDRVHELKRSAQTLLGPPDVWPRLRWPESNDGDFGF
jgi:hypothetical protein